MTPRRPRSVCLFVWRRGKGWNRQQQTNETKRDSQTRAAGVAAGGGGGGARERAEGVTTVTEGGVTLSGAHGALHGCRSTESDAWDPCNFINQRCPNELNDFFLKDGTGRGN